MKSGTVISRHCVVTLRDCRVVVDWGEGSFQDAQSGEFIQCQEQDISHTTQDEELEILRKNGLVSEFDNLHVKFVSLPDSPRKTIN